VKTLLSQEKDAGSYHVDWNGTNERDETVESGIYFLRVTAGSHQKEVKKMILLK
jgi:flagellar hook assembly protein FlgD